MTKKLAKVSNPHAVDASPAHVYPSMKTMPSTQRETKIMRDDWPRRGFV